MLYLLQDGSFAGRLLAAGAIAPPEDWREPARALVRSIVRRADPDFTGYGRSVKPWSQHAALWSISAIRSRGRNTASRTMGKKSELPG